MLFVTVRLCTSLIVVVAVNEAIKCIRWRLCSRLPFKAVERPQIVLTSERLTQCVFQCTIFRERIRQWGYMKVGKAFKGRGLFRMGEYEIRSTAFPSCFSFRLCLLDALARTPEPLCPVFVVPRCSHFFTRFQPLNCLFNCQIWRGTIGFLRASLHIRLRNSLSNLVVPLFYHQFIEAEKHP